MNNEVGVTSPESTIQTLSLFEEYTPPVTYPKEIEKNLGTLIEVEPLNKTKLKEVGLNCNHNTPLSSREVPSFDKPDPQPQPLPNCPPLDASLGPKEASNHPSNHKVLIVFIEADDQAIQTILLGLPEDIYAAVDSCETTQEI
nr:ribonuclease H-like domain-containing protein [Tanacetum cinerariifolium]